MGIDLLAFAAWSQPTPKVTGVKYPIVGYEVKVSRGDYRREILKPDKRAIAVERCHAFYFATPKDLLTEAEKAFVQPEHFEDGSAFVREPCPEHCTRSDRYRKGRTSNRSGKLERVPEVHVGLRCELNLVYGEGEDEHHQPKQEDDPGREPQRWEGENNVWWDWRECKACDGRGYMRKSVVEEEAPTLWVPPDVGLIEIVGRKCRVVRKAPVNHEPRDDWGSIGQIVRWASFRGDPRHRTAVVD